MKKELVMVFDGNNWQDVYYRDGTLDGSIKTSEDAVAYVNTVYNERFKGCVIVVEGKEVLALIPENIKLNQINKG